MRGRRYRPAPACSAAGPRAAERGRMAQASPCAASSTMVCTASTSAATCRRTPWARQTLSTSVRMALGGLGSTSGYAPRSLTATRAGSAGRAPGRRPAPGLRGTATRRPAEVRGRIIEQRQVDAPGQQPFPDLRAQALGHGDRGAGEFATERLHQRRRQHPGDARRQAHRHLAGGRLAQAAQVFPARSARASRARACSTKRRPASVGSTPRPLRYSRCWPSSCSSRRTCRLRVGWATSSISAAREAAALGDAQEIFDLLEVHEAGRAGMRRDGSLGYLYFLYLKSKI